MIEQGLRYRNGLLALGVLVLVLWSLPSGLTAGWWMVTLRGSSPILLVVLGETLTQLTGVINLGVEGQMLMGACVGFVVTVTTQNPWLGLMAGSLAGLAGITETAMIQGRLQVGISSGFGLSGFLVAWLAGNSLLGVIPMSLVVGGILSAGDALQLFAKLPSSVAVILQGILFVSVLMGGQLATRLRERGIPSKEI